MNQQGRRTVSTGSRLFPTLFLQSMAESAGALQYQWRQH